MGLHCSEYSTNVLPHFYGPLTVHSPCPSPKLSLKARTATPAVEMFLQIGREHLSAVHPEANDCRTILVLHDGPKGAICDLSTVQALAKVIDIGSHPPVNVFDIDHEYPGGEPTALVAVLYADIQAKDFATWHQTLVNLHTLGALRYILRHRQSSQEAAATHGNNPLRLSGYGVELAVKKTEYIATDDSAVKDEAAESISASTAVDDDSALDMAGFDFAT